MKEILPVTKLLISFLMIIGGAPGSTSGGIRITSIAILVLTVRATLRNKKDIVVYTLFYAIVVIVSSCIVGYSSYVRNTIEHGHPFYPLYGEGSKDIITTMQPNYFSERNVIQKILIRKLKNYRNLK